MPGLVIDHLPIFCCLLVPLLRSSIAIASVERVIPPLDHTDAAYWATSGPSGSLFFVSKTTNKVYRYFPETNEQFCATIDGATQLSFIMPLGMDYFVLGAGATIMTFVWNGKNAVSPPVQANVSLNMDANTICGKFDAKDQLWIGVETGALYSESNGTTIKQADDVKKPTGIAWNLYGSKLFVADADSFTLVQYAVTLDSGSIGWSLLPKSSLVYDFKANGFAGKPNSIAMDDAGNAWVALTDSNLIVEINTETGTKVTSVEVPAIVSSVAFGGPDLDILYVTTTKDGTSPDAGAVFQVTNTGSKGWSK